MQAISKVQHLIIIERYNVNELAVNEQNPNAKVFYKHLGFKVYKRSETDELTGLIGEVALMRPSKSVQDLELKSVKKKYEYA